jgi:hypothetical protein
VLRGNVFRRNTVALFSDGSTRLVVERNTFADNGWAIQLQANTQDAVVARNDFTGNTFDVATNGGEGGSSRFAGNHWDEYRGYDLDRDGTGDVPHRPVRLFSMIVASHEASMVLLRSFFVDLLDAAERVFPTLTPATIADATPSMRPNRTAISSNHGAVSSCPSSSHDAPCGRDTTPAARATRSDDIGIGRVAPAKQARRVAGAAGVVAPSSSNPTGTLP